MMEGCYERAIRWANKVGDLRMLERFYAGLDNHRRWMKERVG